MANKKFASVVEMARGLGETPAFADELAKHLAQRQIIQELLAQRAAKGLSQKEIAEKLGCTQSRISKLESSSDVELSIGDLMKYADALGLRVGITLFKKDATSVDQVKHHAFCIKRLTDHLAHLAFTDATIAEGVVRFFNEAAFNLLDMLQNSAKKLPQLPEVAFPSLTIETCGVDDSDEEFQEAESSARKHKASCE